MEIRATQFGVTLFLTHIQVSVLKLGRWNISTEIQATRPTYFEAGANQPRPPAWPTLPAANLRVKQGSQPDCFDAHEGRPAERGKVKSRG